MVFTKSSVHVLGASIILLLLYRASRFHPLNKVPGPLVARLSSAWLLYHTFVGDESTCVHALHERYGPIVRNGPNSVDIADCDVLHSIYVERGGFRKPAFYRNFDIDGHQTIFSAINPAHRASRAKAVSPVFSTTHLRVQAQVIADAATGLVERLKRDINRAKTLGSSFDCLAPCRAFAIDSVTSYLFGVKYGGCNEDLIRAENPTKDPGVSSVDGMTASQMVDYFVAVGRVWYMPSWVFNAYHSFVGLIFPSPWVDQSIARVDSFIEQVVNLAVSGATPGSFPARLLGAGFSVSEVRAQCKDLVFAGTDSTAMSLATICFYLVQYPLTYEKLRDEICRSNPTDDQLQSLPYLRAVIKEGLRLSMANPSRLPRVVPGEGFHYQGMYLPGGTIISCTPFELHLNDRVFEEPRCFRPERWIDEVSRTAEMGKSLIPFGLGARQCIARNLATAELFKAVSMIVAEDILNGIENVNTQINIMEWFNSHVIGGRIELRVL